MPESLVMWAFCFGSKTFQTAEEKWGAWNHERGSFTRSGRAAQRRSHRGGDSTFSGARSAAAERCYYCGPVPALPFETWHLWPAAAGLPDAARKDRGGCVEAGSAARPGGTCG